MSASSSSSSTSSSVSAFSRSKAQVYQQVRAQFVKDIESATSPEERAVRQKALEYYDKNVAVTSETSINRNSLLPSAITVKFHAYVFGPIAAAGYGKPVTAKLVMPILPFLFISPGNGVDISNDLCMFSLKGSDGLVFKVYTNSSINISMFGNPVGYNPKGGWHLFEGVQVGKKITYDPHGRPWRNFNCTKMVAWNEGPPLTTMTDLLTRMFSGYRYPLHRLPPIFYPSTDQISEYILQARKELKAADPTKEVNFNAVHTIQEKEEAFRHYVFELSMNVLPSDDPDGMSAYIHEGRSIVSPHNQVHISAKSGEPIVLISEPQYTAQMVIMKDGKPKISDAKQGYPFTVTGNVDFAQRVQKMVFNYGSGSVDAYCLLIHGRYAVGHKYFPFFGVADPQKAAILFSTNTGGKRRIDKYPSVVSGTLDHGRTALMQCNTTPNFVGEDMIPEFGLEVVPFRVYPQVVVGIRATCPEITVEFAIHSINRILRKKGIKNTPEHEASIGPLVVPNGDQNAIYCNDVNVIHELTNGRVFNVTETDTFFVLPPSGYLEKTVTKHNPVTLASAANFRFYMMSNVIHSHEEAEAFHDIQDEFFGLPTGNLRKKALDKKLAEYATVHSNELKKVMVDDVSDIFTLETDNPNLPAGEEVKFVYNIFAISKELDCINAWTAYACANPPGYSEEEIRARMDEVKEMNVAKIESSTRSTVDEDELAALEMAEAKSNREKKSKEERKRSNEKITPPASPASISSSSKLKDDGDDDNEEVIDDETPIVEEETEKEKKKKKQKVAKDTDEDDEEIIEDLSAVIPNPSPPLEELATKTKKKKKTQQPVVASPSTKKAIPVLTSKSSERMKKMISNTESPAKKTKSKK
jgi:hypothetical protein